MVEGTKGSAGHFRSRIPALETPSTGYLHARPCRSIWRPIDWSERWGWCWSIDCCSTWRWSSAGMKKIGIIWLMSSLLIVDNSILMGFINTFLLILQWKLETNSKSWWWLSLSAESKFVLKKFVVVHFIECDQTRSVWNAKNTKQSLKLVGFRWLWIYWQHQMVFLASCWVDETSRKLI